MMRKPFAAAGIALNLLLTGCASAHTVDILGSYFPFWLISMVFGIAVAFASRVVFVRLKIEPYLGPLTVIYLCVMICASGFIWLFIS